MGYSPTTAGGFICRDVTSAELNHWEPGEADAVKRAYPER